jgi:non-specific serine/threonine protein kinase/serine/threonine-protein kinase
MTPERWRQVCSIFDAALKAPDGGRDALVREACGGDDALRTEVEALLQNHAVATREGFLEMSELTASFTPTPAELPGSRVGPYKLLQPLGEGGMGVVYMAEQEHPVRRRVALKVIKPGMDTAQVVARFEAERQALALMDHPHIARVFDAGSTESGRPYFVMELVQGVPITRYCDDARLPARERLGLFVTVCQAVQNAHQKGVIHRDLKPSNVLVTLLDGQPVPKVIDFGVAKAIGQRLTEKTVFTQLGSVVGTLEYMSPEQAGLSALDVDTRSDVYALGVLLYELLTGTTPLDRGKLREAGYAEVLRRIKEEEPPRPSARLSGSGERLGAIAASRGTEPARLTRLVRGDLDWVVMKALEKDRTRRYETANGLARDVQRYLADEIVEARPPSAGYRLKKFVKRHKGQVIAASLLLAALVAGVMGTTLGMAQANRAAESERLAKCDAVEQKRLAEEAAEQERQAKLREAQRADGEQKAKQEAEAKRKEAERNLAFAKKGNEILGSVFAGLEPKQIAESGRPLQDVLRENLGNAVKELEGSAIGEPLEVAAMQETFGSSLLGLGEASLAADVYTKALAIRKAKLGPDHPDTLDSMNNLAVAYTESGQLAKAVPLLEETVDKVKAKLGPDHPDTLTSMNNLAGAYLDSGQLGKAVPLYEETLEKTKAKLGPAHPDTLNMKKNIEFTRALLTAEDRYRAKLAGLGPKHIDTLLARRDIAQMHMSTSRLDDAELVLQEVLHGMSDRAADDAIVVFTTGLLRRCLTRRQKAIPNAWQTFNTQSLLGGALLGQKKYAEAEPLLLKGYEGMKTREKTIPNHSGGELHIPEALDRLIELYTAINRPDEAKKWQAERAKYAQGKTKTPEKQ